MRTLQDTYRNSTIVACRTITAPHNRKGHTAICLFCGKDYTDNISKKATSVICAICTTGLADGVAIHKKEGKINFLELIPHIQNGTVLKFRNRYGFSQSLLARRLGISARQLRRMENSAYIPSSKVIEKVRKKVENVRCP